MLQDGSIPISQLQEVISKLEKKGVLIGIANQACYSGASTLLGSANTCVITAASAFEPAFATFSKDLWSEVIPGRSMEDVFFAARMKHDWMSSPMISTPAGIKTSEALLTIFAS